MRPFDGNLSARFTRCPNSQAAPSALSLCSLATKSRSAPTTAFPEVSHCIEARLSWHREERKGAPTVAAGPPLAVAATQLRHCPGTTTTSRSPVQRGGMAMAGAPNRTRQARTKRPEGQRDFGDPDPSIHRVLGGPQGQGQPLTRRRSGSSGCLLWQVGQAATPRPRVLLCSGRGVRGRRAATPTRAPGRGVSLLGPETRPQRRFGCDSTCMVDGKARTNNTQGYRSRGLLASSAVLGLCLFRCLCLCGC